MELLQFLARFAETNDKCEDQLPFYRTIFQILIENAPIAIYILEDGAYAYVNDHYSKLVRYSKQELINGSVPLEKIFHPDDYPKVRRNIEQRSSIPDTETRYYARFLDKDGCLRHGEIHASSAEVRGKTILFGSVIDVTEQVEVQHRLQEGSERYKSLFYNSPDAIFSFDDEGKFISVNPACETLTGYSVSELLSMSFMPLIVSEDLPSAVIHFKEAKQGIPSTAELAITRKDGKTIHLNATHFPMYVNGVNVGTYGIARDMTQKILYDKQMEQFAFYDSLTQLPNRKLFEDRLSQVINFSKKDSLPFAVLFLDLDRFKFVNDSLGHQLGDEFLKRVSERLKGSIRSTDTVSRLAGDEFTILLPDTSREEVIRLTESINRAMAEPFQVEGHSMTVSASIGVVFSRGQEVTVEEIIRHADTAMYQTKKSKKNSYTVYSPEMDGKAAYKLAIEGDLQYALDNGELELFYQPILDLKTQRVTAMEALIRWHHPKLGLVPPNDFIPVAEESGQILAVGRWVLHAACRQGKAWQDAGISPFKIAVNVSMKQLQSKGFVDSVFQALETAGLASKWLELEVTESVLLEDVGLIKESLMRLKQAGVSISIDDFGTGYTSLSYLRQFPFDKIKIDRSFIDDISRDLNGKQIAAAIISLAHSLNMNVVSEGIENEIQLNYLVEENCDEGQGYLFSKPMPVGELQPFLKAE